MLFRSRRRTHAPRVGSQMEPGTRDRVPVGRISGIYGVKGWVRIYSYTEPREAILEYAPWWIRDAQTWRSHALAEGRRHGKGVVVRLEGCVGRDRSEEHTSELQSH